MTLNAQKILESPDYYPLKFDGPNLLFVRMSRESYFNSVFTLPNRIVTAGPEQWSVPFAELVELFEQARITLPNPSCLFQIAHCGSTLLSRALDQPSSNLVIREPFTLRQFAASPQPDEPHDIEYRRRGLAALWHLLSRQYRPADRVLIKANVPVNFVMDEILEVAPKTSGVLLYCEFDQYLLSVLKADERQQWAQHVVRELMPRIKQLEEFKKINFALLDAVQSAAVLWLSQIRNFEKALNANQALRALQSERFYQQPGPCLGASSAHLGFALNQDQVDKLVTSSLFSHHAKLPEQGYSEQQRQQDVQQLSSKFSDEISQCRDWIRLQGLDQSNTLADQAL